LAQNRRKKTADQYRLIDGKADIDERFLSIRVF